MHPLAHPPQRGIERRLEVQLVFELQLADDALDAVEGTADPGGRRRCLRDQAFSRQRGRRWLRRLLSWFTPSGTSSGGAATVVLRWSMLRTARRRTRPRSSLGAPAGRSGSAAPRRRWRRRARPGSAAQSSVGPAAAAYASSGSTTRRCRRAIELLRGLDGAGHIPQHGLRGEPAVGGPERTPVGQIGRARHHPREIDRRRAAEIAVHRVGEVRSAACSNWGRPAG